MPAEDDLAADTRRLAEQLVPHVGGGRPRLDGVEERFALVGRRVVGRQGEEGGEGEGQHDRTSGKMRAAGIFFPTAGRSGYDTAIVRLSIPASGAFAMRDAIPCTECRDRRHFLGAAGVATAALATGLNLVPFRSARAADAKPAPAEELVKELFAGLSDDQKKQVVKPWEDKRRPSVNPNKALDKKIGEVYDKKQIELLERIVKAMGSGDDGYKQISRGGTWDASKAFANCGADIFGDPSKGKFAFLFTGHHLTIRCDGDSEEGAAFGGPIYYGHTPMGYSTGNMFAYQTEAVKKLFDGPGREAEERRW